MRSVVSSAAAAGIAAPAYAASLSYFDTFRSARMPSNLIQAQRDYFRAHTYERNGKDRCVSHPMVQEVTQSLY